MQFSYISAENYLLSFKDRINSVYVEFADIVESKLATKFVSVSEAVEAEKKNFQGNLWLGLIAFSVGAALIVTFFRINPLMVWPFYPVAYFILLAVFAPNAKDKAETRAYDQAVAVNKSVEKLIDGARELKKRKFWE